MLKLNYASDRERVKSIVAVILILFLWLISTNGGDEALVMVVQMLERAGRVQRHNIHLGLRQFSGEWHGIHLNMIRKRRCSWENRFVLTYLEPIIGGCCLGCQWDRNCIYGYVVDFRTGLVNSGIRMMEIS